MTTWKTTHNYHDHENDVEIVVQQYEDKGWIWDAWDTYDDEGNLSDESPRQYYLTPEEAQSAALDWYEHIWLPYYQQTGERILP